MMQSHGKDSDITSDGFTPTAILLTGGAGFIGSNVAKALVKKYREYKIVVLDKLDDCSNMDNIKECFDRPNFKFIKGDVQSCDLVAHVLKTEKIDTIMHFAAQTHVDNSFGNSFSFTRNNVKGTHVLLEASRFAPIRRFLHVSTDEVYGERSKYLECGISENSERDPTNPYSATKAAAEMLVKAYGYSYNIPYIITRGNNVYGPTQFPEKVVPKFLCLVQRGEKLPIHGDGSSMRSFLYIDDVARAFDVVLHRGVEREVYNISTTFERTVKDVAKDILEIYGRTFEEGVEFVQDRLFNDFRYFLDNAKMNELGWKAEIPWEEGLRRTAEWYSSKENLRGWKNYELVLSAHPTAIPSTMIQSILEPELKIDLDEGINEKGGPRFLVFGRSGWIGGLLGKILTEKGHTWRFADSRLENRQDLLLEFHQYKPTHVLNAAGLTGRPNVDWCEEHKEEVIRVNVCGCLNLADICASKGVHCLIFATGCIFEYNKSHPLGSGIGFTEDDAPNFDGSYYSKTKGMVETLLRDYKDNVCVLRVRMPISSDLQCKRNFIYKIKNYAKIVNIPNSMTVLDELLPYSIEMSLRQLSGVYNFTNPGVISHNELLDLYRDYLEPELSYTNFSLEEQAKVIRAARSNNELNSTKLKNEFPEMLGIRDSVIKFVFEPAKANQASL